MKSKIVNAMRALSIMLSLIIVLLFVQSVPAQETRGTIRGQITDPDKSPIPDSPHRLSLSGIYALSFGKNQPFLSNANGIVDRIVNG